MNVDLCKIFNVKEGELFSLVSEREIITHRIHNNKLQTLRGLDGEFMDSLLAINSLEELKVVRHEANERILKEIIERLEEYCNENNLQLFVQHNYKLPHVNLLISKKGSYLKPFKVFFDLDEVEVDELPDTISKISDKVQDWFSYEVGESRWF